MTTNLTEPLPEGIYIGLSDDRYHADPSLGSTNLRQIRRSPPNYWWHSWMNPAKPEDTDTRDRLRGKAIHSFVLEGQQSFDGRYTRRPDDPEGASPADKSATTKRANAKAAAEGRQSLHGDDYDRIAIAGRMITANPELANAFQGGIPEVSVFWERDGVRLKARFDYLKPRALTDLKSIANILKLDFVQACKLEIARRDHPMQAALYLEGRSHMQRLFEAGKVFGAECDKTLLQRCAESEQYAFAFIFYQAKDAPLTWGVTVSRGNPCLDFARNQIEDAIEKFRAYREKFGTSMWVLSEKLEELSLEEMPAWYAMN